MLGGIRWLLNRRAEYKPENCVETRDILQSLKLDAFPAPGEDRKIELGHITNNINIEPGFHTIELSRTRDNRITLQYYVHAAGRHDVHARMFGHIHFNDQNLYADKVQFTGLQFQHQNLPVNPHNIGQVLGRLKGAASDQQFIPVNEKAVSLQHYMLIRA